MTTNTETEFGYYPRYININNPDYSIEPISNFDDIIKDIENHKDVDNGWIYSKEERLFGLPKTHAITLKKDYIDNIDFIIWCMSFFSGMRLTSKNNGVLDATPIEIGKLVDFNIYSGKTLEYGIKVALEFLKQNKKINKKINILTSISSVIHLLFLSQNPKSLYFESFMYSYIAIDGCYKITTQIKSGKKFPHNHAGRIKFMCGEFNISIPEWAKLKYGNNRISTIRNKMYHEGIFDDQPLGFLLNHDDFSTQEDKNNLIQKHKVKLIPKNQIRNFICRLLVAILCETNNNDESSSKKIYLNSSLDDRQKKTLDLGDLANAKQ